MKKRHTPSESNEEPQNDDCSKKKAQKKQNRFVTPNNRENAECALSGMQCHVSQSLGEALNPCFMAGGL